MQAVRIVGPSKVELADIPIKKPKKGEVLIKVIAAGLCGTDYDLYTNDMIYLNEGRSKLPIIPGHEWSGVIEEVGEGVTGYKIGEKVTGENTVSCRECEYCIKGMPNQCINRTETGIMMRDGGFAEYITFPASHLHKFTNISFEEAAMIEPTGVAMHAARMGKITPMDNVLVIGPGPVGLQAAQIAKKIFGAKNVILSGTRQERLDIAKNFDLDGYINIREQDLESEVRRITNGKMIDVVIEESGGVSAFSDIKKVINPRGRVVLNGFFGSKHIDVDFDFLTIMEINLVGSLGSPLVWSYVIELLESGKIESKSIISHVLKLEEFEKGMDIMINRKENVCKVILKP